MKTRFCLLFSACAVAFLAAIPASAHVERPAYWPNPAVDTSVPGGTGGKVPAVRSLPSALNKKKRGTTRVVCQPDSMTLLRASIAKARKEGYFIRPSVHKSFSAKQAKKLLAVNKK